LSLVLLAASTAIAAEPIYADALERFDAGRFRSAAEIAASLGSADGFALATRATAARATYLATGEERLRLFEQAADYARRALELDPDHIEANLQLVISLGQLSRSIDPLQAYFAGHASEAKERLEAVLARAPDNAYAHAIFGAWHTEIVANAGSVLAESLYSASAERALEEFEMARELDPDNLLVLTESANALLRLGGAAYERKARAFLDKAMTIRPRTALQWLARRRASQLSKDLESGTTSSAGTNDPLIPGSPFHGR